MVCPLPNPLPLGERETGTICSVPCIPDYREKQEMHARGGVHAWRRALERLAPAIRRFLPVFEALLAAHEELSGRADAQHCLTFLRQLGAKLPPVDRSTEVAAMEAEARRLRNLAETAEAQLCFAGTLAWIAERGRPKKSRSAGLKALLEHHQKHREADRRARLRQLRGEVSRLKKQRQQAASLLTAIENLEGRIAAIKALSIDAICSDRSVF